MKRRLVLLVLATIAALVTWSRMMREAPPSQRPVRVRLLTTLDGGTP